MDAETTGQVSQESPKLIDMGVEYPIGTLVYVTKVQNQKLTAFGVVDNTEGVLTLKMVDPDSVAGVASNAS